MTAGTRNTKQTPSRARCGWWSWTTTRWPEPPSGLFWATTRCLRSLAEAADADGAFAAVQEHRPDLVLMDIRMPGGGLQADAPHQGGLSPSAHRHDDRIRRPSRFVRGAALRRAGVRAENLETHQWTAYLRSVMDGATPISDSFAERIIHELTGTAALGAAVPERLTARETDVLRLVADGLTNREIAGRLGISQNTVKNHLKNIMAKVQADNRTQLVRLALELGMLS